MEALHTRLGKDNTELKFYDGAIGLVTVGEDGEATEKLMGINSVIDGVIFDSYEKTEHDYVIKGLDREQNTVELVFTPKAGYIRGLQHIFEEVRKGKESVTVRGLDRKPLFKRMRKGIKPLN